MYLHNPYQALSYIFPRKSATGVDDIYLPCQFVSLITTVSQKQEVKVICGDWTALSGGYAFCVGSNATVGEDFVNPASGGNGGW